MTGIKTKIEDLEGMLPHRVSFGVSEDGYVMWPISGAEPDDDDEDDEDDDADEDDDDDDDDSDDDEDDDDSEKSKKSKGKDKDSKDKDKDEDEEDLEFWKSRASRLRSQKEAADRRATAAERENRRLKARKGSQEALTEQDKTDLKDAQSNAEKATSALNGARLQIAILTDNTYAWQDPELVLQALANDDTVEIDENGKAIGVKQALRSLARKKPFLLKVEEKVSSKEEEDDPDEDDSTPKAKRTGSARSGGRKSKVDRKALIEKYPQLGRR